jgi:mannose-6-phosphate isomerase-like protein (cupin superfamily)
VRNRATSFKGLIAATVVVVSIAFSSAAEAPGAKSWTASELKDFERSLGARMNSQRIATQSLGSFENHNMLVAHRESNGQGEIHERQADIFVVQTGEAVVLVGGELVGAKQVRPHELLGASIRGGVEKKLKAGDVIHIPARTPHQMLVASGQQITYLVVKVNVP